jgi:glutathione S-transferase
VSRPRLLTIPISHYCEKARWALDRAGIAYDEERHVQGVSVVCARRAGGGRTLPVLVAGDRVLAESEDIVRWADERLPAERRLVPDDPVQRRAVLTLARWFDAGLGPAGRRLCYALLLPDRQTLVATNNQGIPRWEDVASRRLWPLLGLAVRVRLRMPAELSPADERIVRAAFDDVARRLADGRPFLCGERFTAADLTFAALSAPVLAPRRYGVRLPQPGELPPAAAALVARFRAHPAGAFALRLTETQRPVPGGAGTSPTGASPRRAPTGRPGSR